jgi:pimeloyl-ACP methyl ester carboxylesterase
VSCKRLQKLHLRRQCIRKSAILLAGLSILASVPARGAEPEPVPLPGGARWAAQVPANWNGTLLLWSRGYSPNVGAPEIGPAPLQTALLSAGYALAGSDYGASGWALEQAVPAQFATLAAFTARYGKPRRTIAWGNSMGGLVSTEIAERRPARVDGAAVFCASIGGAVGMMNMALDGAYAFRTLVAPDSGIRVVGIDDDMVNARRVSEALAAAMATPEGRARTALAGVLAGLPGWTIPGSPAPAPTDHEGQIRQMADAFVRGVFLPRVDQERRAGGSFSWNRGIDYRRQLALSGRREMVETLYRQAGLDLEADLARLNGGTRIAAAPHAVAYMTNHYTSNARPAVPLLTVQAVGDGLTSPSLQRAYVEAVRGSDVRSLWVNQAGHCNFTAQTVVPAIRYLEARIANGRWPAQPAGFIAHRPPPMLRPCVRGGRCR